MCGYAVRTDRLIQKVSLQKLVFRYNIAYRSPIEKS